MAQENGHRVFLTISEINKLRVLNGLGRAVASRSTKSYGIHEPSQDLVDFSQILENKLSKLMGEEPWNLKKHIL